MTSVISEKDNSYSLDERYGKRRFGYSFETAFHMARLDELIEAAGVQPGDNMEVLLASWEQHWWRDWEEKPSDEDMVLAWVETGGTFLEIDNGRLRCTFPGENNVGAVFTVETIWGVRKST